jgi:hypothetical protein
LIDDPDNYLHGNLEQLTKEDFKERLIVAEKVMKQLFIRNKELEDKTNGESQNATTNDTSGEGHLCLNCKNNNELK